MASRVCSSRQVSNSSGGLVDLLMIFIKTPCEGQGGEGGGNLMHSTVIFPPFDRAVSGGPGR